MLQTFDNAMKNLENGIFKKADLKQDFVLELKYPRAEFLSQFRTLLSTLSFGEQNTVAQFYGLRLDKISDDNIQINGYPYIPNKNAEKELTTQMLNTVEKLRQPIVDFVQNNKISVKNLPELQEAFNNILNIFPELLMIIGKKQHKTHSYTVDIHTLNVLQEVMNNPLYSLLTEQDKRILQISVLLHDLTKAENLVDKTHPANSAKDAQQILEKTDLSPFEKESICKLIKTHDWLEKCNLYGASDEQKAMARLHTAQELKSGNLFELSKMLTAADLKSVRSDGSFYEMYKEQYFSASEAISELIKNINLG